MTDKAHIHLDEGFSGFHFCALSHPAMFHHALTPPARGHTSEMAALLDHVAQASSRPRYAFMVLSLIAEVARPDGSAGPFVLHEGRSTLLRDWLCDALAPMGARDPKRLLLAKKVRRELQSTTTTASNHPVNEAAVAAAMHDRIRKSGKTNLSRAVSELVQAGLIRRHYQGFRVDHHNRGAGRHAVYTLLGRARCLMARENPSSAPPEPRECQAEFRFN